MLKTIIFDTNIRHFRKKIETIFENVSKSNFFYKKKNIPLESSNSSRKIIFCIFIFSVIFFSVKKIFHKKNFLDELGPSEHFERWYFLEEEGGRGGLCVVL